MPDVVSVGPLAFPLDRLVAVALMWAFLAGSSWWMRDEAGPARRTPLFALLIGIVASRANCVAMHWDAYRPDPATALYLWQGGFDPVAGIAAAAAVSFIGLRRLRKVAAPWLILAATSGLWFGYLQLEAQRPRPAFPDEVRLTDLDGRPVSLDALRGRPFVVNLWASWCGPCRREMPMVIDVASATPGVPVLLVNQGEDPRLIRRFLEQEGLSAHHILSDRGASLMRQTGSSGLPTTLFVRADGRIDQVQMGELSRAGLLQGIERLAM